jgi:GxxExxY protein
MPVSSTYQPGSYLEEGLTGEIIGVAIDVHRFLGPELLESAYQACLAHELSVRNIPFVREWAIPVAYKGVMIDCGYRADFVVGERILLELKSVERLTPLHEAQLLSYLKLSGIRVGLLMNFNSLIVKHNIKRKVL